jgi:hypothetical protein
MDYVERGQGQVHHPLCITLMDDGPAVFVNLNGT